VPVQGEASAYNKLPLAGWLWWAWNENSGDTGGIATNNWQVWLTRSAVSGLIQTVEAVYFVSTVLAMCRHTAGRGWLQTSSHDLIRITLFLLQMCCLADAGPSLGEAPVHDCQVQPAALVHSGVCPGCATHKAAPPKEWRTGGVDC
jgi:hypothetical protein